MQDGKGHLRGNSRGICLRIAAHGPCKWRMSIVVCAMPERTQKPTGPAPWERKDGGGDGPKSPDVKKPDTKGILERMRRVDPDQARRYRQRTGQ